MQAFYNKDKLLELAVDLVVTTCKINKAITHDSKWLNIANGVITVKKGFVWNGCTWARDGARGVDGLPISWKASCVHDAMCPIKIKGVSINQKNLIFYDELVKVDFKFLGIPACTMYYIGVSVGVPIRLLFLKFSQ